MVKKSKVVAQDTVVSQEPIAETSAPAEATQKAEKKVRYAPRDVLANQNAVITVRVPQAKGPDGKSKSADRFNRFHRSGQTVGEFVSAYKAAQLRPMLANADLRWDLQHGFISIEAAE